MKVLIYIDKLFNAYYKAKKDYINFIHPKIFYTDWRIKGTIKSSFINGKRIIYPEPINYNELKEILIKKQNRK
jgi:hypothetical protein